MHRYRCETCDYRWDKKDGIKCPYDKEDVYYLLKEEMSFPRGSWLFTSVVGCASHSEFMTPLDILEEEFRPPPEFKGTYEYTEIVRLRNGGGKE